jgi:prepilin-type N-terminal cleavage/methylation domain-containing protein
MKSLGRPLRCLGGSGFTLMELLLALMIMSIVLAAVAAFAFAMGSANSRSSDTSSHQAQLRYATIRIGELVRNCKLVTSLDSTGFHIWWADDDADGQIDSEEVVKVEINTSTKQLRLITFSPQTPPASILMDIASFLSGVTGNLLKLNCNPVYTTLIRNCYNVQFQADSSPPYCKRVTILFDLPEEKTFRKYQINSSLHSWSGHLLDSSGNLVVLDDDE